MKSVVIEPIYVCKDYRNLYSHFYSKKFLDRSSYASRLHFLRSDAWTLTDIAFNSENVQKDYLGFSVVEPVKKQGLGRTVIDPYKVGRDQNNFFCLRTTSRAHVLGAEYTVEGFPYRSQSSEATVCAQTALWCACRYLSDRYSFYGELYPYDLIEMTGDTNGRRVPYRGMSYQDYSTILSEFGCHPAIIRPKTEVRVGGTTTKDWSRDRNEFYDLYSYMESGFPVLTSFGGHVVNIIGHTLSDDVVSTKHIEESGFLNSAAFLKEYVVVDDNFFPYQRLGYEGATQYYQPSNYPRMQFPPSIDNILAAVVPLPEKAYLPPADARNGAYKFLSHSRLKNFINDTVHDLGCQGSQLVARHFLTSSISWKRRKREFSETTNDELLAFPITLNLPHFIWVTEVSAVDLYKQRRCFGEVVVDATISRHDWEPIYARMGRYLILGEQEQRIDSVPTSYPQYTHNLGRL